MIPLVVVIFLSDGMIRGITERYIETGTFHLQLRPYEFLEDDEWIGIGFSKNSVMVCVYLSISTFAELMASSLSKREPRNAILFE